MKGLCHVCYSSEVSLMLDEDFWAKCEKCRKQPCKIPKPTLGNNLVLEMKKL